MKTSMISKYAMLAFFSTSFIALNNCGQEMDSTANLSEQDSLEAQTNGPASNKAILGPIPPGFDGLPDLDPAIAGVEINCTDGRDNEGDGLADCMDNDCHIHPECAEFGPPLEEIINSRALAVYPNGAITPEDIAILKQRGADDDDHHRGWLRNNFFASHVKDCWVAPPYQDPYYNIPLGEALVAGPDGPVGPVGPQAVAFYGPRAGLINECEYGTDIVFHHFDDDNGAGAGASGDTDDDEGGVNDEF